MDTHNTSIRSDDTSGAVLDSLDRVVDVGQYACAYCQGGPSSWFDAHPIHYWLCDECEEAEDERAEEREYLDACTY